MFNPRPNIRYVPITAGHTCAVIDDFLLDPQQLIAHALAHGGEFATDPDNFYPGPELPLSQPFAFALDEFFMQHVRRSLGARRTVSVSARLSMATLAPPQLNGLQRLCHRDAAASGPGEGVAASVAYLFDAPQLGGTSFYLPRQSPDDTARLLRAVAAGEVSVEPGYLAGSNQWFEQVCTVPAKFNRAIFYDGSVFHAAQIEQPKLLDNDPATGRLTMNGFFRFKKAAV
jgi:hypothetical protein